MDGTLIPASVPTASQTAFRSRKAHISQNVLAICDFDMMFTYVYAEMRSIAPTVFRFHHLENTILLMPVLRIILLFSHLIEVADIICKNGHVVGET